jgi:hypothetical protein
LPIGKLVYDDVGSGAAAADIVEPSGYDFVFFSDRYYINNE